MRILIATVTRRSWPPAGGRSPSRKPGACWSRDAVEAVGCAGFSHPSSIAKLTGKATSSSWSTRRICGRCCSTRTDNPRLVRKADKIPSVADETGHSKFTRHVERFRPERCCARITCRWEILGRLKAKAGTAHSPFTVSVVTDFEAHALWMEPGVDLYARRRGTKGPTGRARSRCAKVRSPAFPYR